MGKLFYSALSKHCQFTRFLLILVLAPFLFVDSLAYQAKVQTSRQDKEKQQNLRKEREQKGKDAPNQAKPVDVDLLLLDSSLAGIAEFKVRPNAFDTAFPRRASKRLAEIVNTFSVRKKGRFYGSVYEYHRNDFFDARNFFDPVGEKLPEFKRNQFGGTLGAYGTRRLQVFGTYDGLRINKGSTILSLVPTLAMRAGDFSAFEAAMMDPRTGKPFPNNQIPQSRFDPAAIRMMATIPNPNRDDLARNFVNNQPAVDNSDSVTVRVDYEFSQNSKLFSNYTFTRQNEMDVSPLPEFSTTRTNRNQDISLTYNRNLGSNLVTSFRADFNRRIGQQFSKHAFQTGILDSLGINGVSVLDGADEGYPEFTISGYASLGQDHRNQSPQTDFNNYLKLTGNFTYVYKNHKFSFGLERQNTQLNDYRSGGLRRGKFDFFGAFTGDSFADFLLGIPAQASRSLGSDRQDQRQHSWKFYLRDNWRINSQFSLSLALAYNLLPVSRSVHDNVALFYPLLFEPPLDGQVVTTGSPEAESLGLTGLAPGQAAYTDKNDWEPSIGLAYSPFGNNKFVIHASYGINYRPPDMRRTLRFIGRNYPFYWTEKASSPTDPSLVLSNPFETAVPSEQTIQALDPNIRTSYIQNWQLSIQNEFIRAWNIELRYSGRKSTRAARILPANVPLPGEGVIQTRRPNPNFGRFDIGESSGSSISHTLYVQLRKRLTQDFSILSHYTWTRTISDYFHGDPANPRNLRAERAILSYGGAPMRFTLNYIWDLPIGRNQHITAEWAGKLRWMFEGWRVSGITTIQLGSPFTPRLMGDPNNDGVSGDRPDRIASGLLPRSWQSIDRWFATDAFVRPEMYAFGNSGRNILLNPGEKKWDISLIKRTQISDAGNTIEFRIQLFNAFNHVNFENPGTTFGSSSFGVISNAKDAREIEFALKYSF